MQYEEADSILTGHEPPTVFAKVDVTESKQSLLMHVAALIYHFVFHNILQTVLAFATFSSPKHTTFFNSAVCCPLVFYSCIINH